MGQFLEVLEKKQYKNTNISNAFHVTNVLPLTLSCVDWVTDPARFVALQVYSPMWVKSTLEITNMLALWPSWVVLMLGPEFSSLPFRLQVMVTGMSP